MPVQDSHRASPPTLNYVHIETARERVKKRTQQFTCNLTMCISCWANGANGVFRATRFAEWSAIFPRKTFSICTVKKRAQIHFAIELLFGNNILCVCGFVRVRACVGAHIFNWHTHPHRNNREYLENSVERSPGELNAKYLYNCARIYTPSSFGLAALAALVARL